MKLAAIKPILVSSLIAAVVAGWSVTEAGKAFNYNFAVPIGFHLRDKAGRTPPRVDNIKVVNFDDHTVAKLQTLSLNLEQWRILLQGIAGHNPSMIFVDELPDEEDLNPTEVAELAETIRNLSAPVIVGSSTFKDPIVMKNAVLRFEKGDFLWNNIAPANIAELPKWIPSIDHYVFSAPLGLISAFKHSGHLANPQFGWLPPILKIGSGSMLAHLGLYAAGTPSISAKGVSLGNTSIPLNEHGELFINFLPPDLIKKGDFNLNYFYNRTLKGEPIKALNPGDIVAIFTGVYTGHGGWVNSPYGHATASSAILNVMHNALTGRWVTIVSHEWLFIFLFGAIAILLASVLNSNTFWLTFLGGFFATVGCGIAVFVYRDFLFPWFYCSVSFALAGISLYAQKLLAADKEQWRLKHELLTAKTVQNQLFPPTEKIEALVSIAARYEPAAECGGDFWDQFSTPDGNHFIIIGDAVGHGASAALVAAAANACCLSLAHFKESGALPNLSPGEILKHMNTVLFRSFQGEVTMTCFVAAINSGSGQLTYANAGHCFPLHIPGNTSVGEAAPKIKLLSAKGDPLGVSATPIFPDKVIPIKAGEKFFFYSDGITEAWGPEKTQYGSKRLYQFATQNRESAPMDFIQALLENVRIFQKAVPQGDDMTSVLVAIR